MDPDAVCKEQAAERVVSRSSFESVISNVVSCGANFSVTALKCTVTRAIMLLDDLFSPKMKILGGIDKGAHLEPVLSIHLVHI
jgi:hypothetical protein